MENGKTIFLNLKNNSISNTICFLSYLGHFIKFHNPKFVYILTDHNFIYDSNKNFKFVDEIDFEYDLEITLNYDRKILENVLYGLSFLSKKILNIPQSTKPTTPPVKDYQTHMDDGKIIICSYDENQIKNWPNVVGWQILLNSLRNGNFGVFDLTNSPYDLKFVTNISHESLEKKIKHIANCRTLITLNNDFAWIGWAYNIPVVLISNYTKEFNDFECFRVSNEYGCSGCYNNFISDSKCPLFLNTPREHECHRSITPHMVVNQLNKALTVQDTYKYEFEDICYNLIDKLPKTYPIIDKNSKNKTLLVETRPMKHLEFVIKNTIQKVGDNWGHIIYCGESNYEQIKSICDQISEDIEIRLLKENITRNTYNNLFLSLDFWNEIDSEKVLVYQTDTFIFKELDKSFLQYDWIGSAWSNDHTKNIENSFLKWKDLWGCNGGLNIRSVSIIKKLLRRFAIPKSLYNDCDKLTEDTYYSWHIKKQHKFPKRDIVDLFSNELRFNDDIFGTHQPWIGNFPKFKDYINFKYY